MRYLILLLATAVTAPGWVNEDGYDSSIPEGTLPAGGDEISLTIIDTFRVPSAGNMLGLDTQDGCNQLVVMDSDAGVLRAVIMGTGTTAWTVPIPYSNTFGCCHSWPSPYHMDGM